MIACCIQGSSDKWPPLKQPDSIVFFKVAQFSLLIGLCQRRVEPKVTLMSRNLRQSTVLLQNAASH